MKSTSADEIPPAATSSPFPGWELRIAPTEAEGSVWAGKWLADALTRNPALLLCAATGASPTSTYAEFVNRVQTWSLPVDQLRLLKLDEWEGLTRDDPASCESYLRANLVQPLGLREECVTGFRGQTQSPREECHRIENWLRQHGPIDVCVLGLGLNGHLGFNEPGDALRADAHVALLTEESLSHPMLSTARALPRHGLTVGMRGILAARAILLLVFGRRKAAQLRRLFRGPLTPGFPASFLSLHPRGLCICDQDAAEKLGCAL